MAAPTKRFSYNMDLLRNQILNAVIQNLPGPPSSPTEGQVYYDTTLHQFGAYQGSSLGWVYLSVGYTQAQIQDIVGAEITGTVVTSSYDSTAKKVTLSIGSGQVTNAMLATGISADKLVDGTTNGYYTLAERSKLAGVAPGATAYTDTQARANRLDQFAAPTAPVAFGAQRITNLADPQQAQDAATKAYVDATATGLDLKASVRAVSTTNITLSGTQTIDGYAAAVGDRILVVGQTNQSQNGIYVVASGAWTRSSDADNSPTGEVTSGMFTFVEAGTTYAATGWVLATNTAITLGTTALVFAQFSGPGTYLAGNGLQTTGNTFSVKTVTGGGIVAAAAGLSIDPAVVPRIVKATIGDGSSTSFTITHNLNTQDLAVAIRDTTTNEIVDAAVVHPSLSTTTISFATAPATGAFRATLLG